MVRKIPLIISTLTRVIWNGQKNTQNLEKAVKLIKK